MRVATGPMPAWLKTAITLGGALLALPGLLAGLGYLCTLLSLMLSGTEAVGDALLSLTLVAVTLGVGGLVAWQGLRSLAGRPSRPLRLPPAWLLAGLFALCVAAGGFVWVGDVAAPLSLPPLLLVAAAMPPLAAVSWFAQSPAEGLTWRRGLVAFAAGATVSVALAALLEFLFPSAILALVLDLRPSVLEHGRSALSALAGQDVASAIADPGFVFVLVQVAVIAPLAEELTKPLATLPLIGRLGRRDAFLVAAMAGAGFATLESVLYAGLGLYFWAGILVVRALGGAIHPLGAGLVGLAWRDILNGEPRAWPVGLLRLGAAIGVHAVWNGGSFLVITLAGARFFGELPPAVRILGLPTAGTTLAFLLVLGLAALGLGKAMAGRDAAPQPLGEPRFVLSDRALAVWAVTCLGAIVPAGIAVLRLVVH